MAKHEGLRSPKAIAFIQHKRNRSSSLRAKNYSTKGRIPQESRTILRRTKQIENRLHDLFKTKVKEIE